MNKNNKPRFIFIQPNSPFVSESIPLALAYVSAILKEHGAEVKVIDGTAPYAEYTDEKMVQICKDFKADVVGVVLMTSHIYKAYDLIPKLKKLNIPIIGGGYHASKFPEEVLSHGIDIALRGETDKTIKELADYLQGKRKLEDIKGVSFKKDGKVI